MAEGESPGWRQRLPFGKADRQASATLLPEKSSPSLSVLSIRCLELGAVLAPVGLQHPESICYDWESSRRQTMHIQKLLATA